MKQQEVVTSKFEIGTGGFSGGLNVKLNNRGQIERRKGYTTFGEMVDELWKINTQNKKMGFTCEYTVKLPLKGRKPIYKRTLERNT